MNNEFWIASLATDRSYFAPNLRHRRTSQFVLPSRLPTTAFLSREASQSAETALETQRRLALLEGPSSPIRSPTDSDEQAHRRSASTSTHDSRNSQVSTKAKPWREPEPFQIYQAIEKKDLAYLMEVRDRSFPLLLKKTQGSTPLLHALRLGQSHREVAIVLVGALSRWINHLDDADFQKPSTRETLRGLRTNLKLAIDYGLATAQSDLIPSFMQALIMSEGDKWIHRNVELLALSLRTGPAAKPVQTALEAVRAFATKELGRAESIAGFDDYCSNAALDLVILGAWSLVTDSIKADPLPTYTFARDDRTYRMFTEHMKTYKSEIAKLRSKRLRWQLKVLEDVPEGRSTTLRSKLEQVAGMLDDEKSGP